MDKIEEIIKDGILLGELKRDAWCSGVPSENIENVARNYLMKAEIIRKKYPDSKIVKETIDYIREKIKEKIPENFQ